MGAYLKWSLIRGWVLIRINTVCWHEKIPRPCMDKNWNKSFTNINDRTGAVGRKGLEHKSSTSLPSIYFRVYTFSTVQIPVHNATKGRGGRGESQKPIQYVKIHFQDRRRTGSLHNRNCAEITDGSCVWKKALSDMVLSGVVKTQALTRVVGFDRLLSL